MFKANNKDTRTTPMVTDAINDCYKDSTFIYAFPSVEFSFLNPASA